MIPASDPLWYDSVWLEAYVSARETIAERHPGRLDDFVHAFDILRTNPEFSARYLKGSISPALLARIRDGVRTVPQDGFRMHELRDFGRLVVHDHPDFVTLQAELTDEISDLAGEAVEPCYNFLGLYTRLGSCGLHLDAPLAKWTLDICIDQSAPWPVWFSRTVPWPETRPARPVGWDTAIKRDPALGFSSIAMEPGDAILFSGSSQWHYRDPLPQEGRKHFCDLLFLHYTPVGARQLALPTSWAELFGLPELDTLPAIIASRGLVVSALWAAEDMAGCGTIGPVSAASDGAVSGCVGPLGSPATAPRAMLSR